MKFGLKSPMPTEADEAECLLRWAYLQRWSGQRLSDLLIMIPNGALLGGDARQRAMTMARFKRMGFRTGVSDYLVPIQRPPYPGLFLELKRRKGGVISDDQEEFMAQMSGLGWKTAICFGWEESRDVIVDYLKIKGSVT